MDLIYADKNKKDIGIITSYDMDMAFGSDENNFIVKIDRPSHCCDEGYFIYVEGEEYGGIVDAIEVSTEEDEITYSGRTWHGILESRVIEPETGNDYRIVSGDANDVLAEIIEFLDIDDLFTTPSEQAGINIDYQFERYTYGYTGIKKMLKEAGAKLKVRWINGYIELSAEYFADYSQDEEFDTSQIDFDVKRKFLPINHIICLGQGDLKDRAVIHLFTNKNGGVQPYATTDNPLQDSDYILDQRNKVLSGADEITEVYDYASAQITENYIALTSKPSDWEENCENYYYIENEDNYKNVKKEEVGYDLLLAQPADWLTNFTNYYTSNHKKVEPADYYSLLTTQPGSWKSRYKSYYYKDGNTYKTVEAVQDETYKAHTKRPNDWAKNYGNYYYYFTDGVVSEYRSVSGESYYIYEKQTTKPSDWDTNCDAYYRNATAKELKANRTEKYKSVQQNEKITYKLLHSKPGQWNNNFRDYYRSATAEELKQHPDEKYVKLSGSTAPTWEKGKYFEKIVNYSVPKWKKNTYYTKYSKQKAPKWSIDGQFYTKKVKSVAPTFVSGTYYKKISNTAPAWASDTYYSYDPSKVAPEWEPGDTYFRKVIDRYADMVASAIAKFEEYNITDQLNIDLEETERVYDVGDYVGAIEEVTGIMVTQEIVKKIIKITNDDISISYEVK